MLSPISAAIHKLLRIEPQQLKAEQFTPPQLPPGSRPAISSNPPPAFNLPQAQWQVVRMLAASSGLSLTQTYTPPTLQSPSFMLAGGEGELQLRIQIEGQPHTVRWQVSQGEAQLLSSPLPAALSIALLPSVDQGWRLVAKGMLHSDPLQLLWTPYGNSAQAGPSSAASQSLTVWLRSAFITAVILLVLCYWLF